MKTKHKFAVCAVCVALVGTLSVTALAHGRHGSHAAAVSYPQCPVEDCQSAVRHAHDGVTYCGHTYGDGHSHPSACGVEGCTAPGEHTHQSGGHHGHHHA